jgi:hypothetical protein
MGNDIEWEQPPADQNLCAPGGASLEVLTRLAPQWRAWELYSEFDFTDPCPSSLDLVTVSYGENIPEIRVGDSVDFRPFIERAESFANVPPNAHRTRGRRDAISNGASRMVSCRSQIGNSSYLFRPLGRIDHRRVALRLSSCPENGVTAKMAATGIGAITTIRIVDGNATSTAECEFPRRTSNCLTIGNKRVGG